MRFSDFEYDGISLSSMGLIIVSFDGAQDDEITTDSQRTFNSISLFGGRYQPFLTSIYEDRLEIEFAIAKNFCEDETDVYFTIQQIENIQYWLNRPTPHIFRILDDAEYADVYWEGSFNLEWVKSGEDTIGFVATFISTRPYAIGNESLFTKRLTQGEELEVPSFSYDEGSITPIVILGIREDGDLEFTNHFNNRDTVTTIRNCRMGEEITFTNMQQIISSFASHDIYNDFNWVFPQIYNIFNVNDGNEENSQRYINVFSSNLNCDCTISYHPVRKVTFS